jgi:hypothetical protein
VASAPIILSMDRVSALFLAVLVGAGILLLAFVLPSDPGWKAFSIVLAVVLVMLNTRSPTTETAPTHTPDGDHAGAIAALRAAMCAFVVGLVGLIASGELADELFRTGLVVGLACLVLAGLLERRAGSHRSAT